jgi:phosphotriesterase-related protein
MGSWMTTLGTLETPPAGILLPHEHIFVDLRPLDTPGHGQADAADVIGLMAPELERARASGVAALVECTPEGVGRRVDLVKAVSLAANFPVMVPTGIYREPWVPGWAHSDSEEDLYAWMRRELDDQIGETGVRAGFIKLSAGDDGLMPVETKILRAAGKAGAASDAAIGSHTIRGRVVRDQLDILEACGFAARRYIWIHANAEPDFELNLEMARRGAWIEYDGIGWGDTDTFYVERVLAMRAAGFASRVLLSQDRGWYSPAEPGGGIPQPFTYLGETFLPKLRAAGVDEGTIHQLTVENPFKAFSRA